MCFAHVWHNQIPFAGDARSAGVKTLSNRGPPGEAAVTWAATPMFTDPLPEESGPLVSRRQSGFEQECPARAAKRRTTELVKSSRIDRHTPGGSSRYAGSFYRPNRALARCSADSVSSVAAQFRKASPPSPPSPPPAPPKAGPDGDGSSPTARDDSLEPEPPVEG
jgi:hypothetical protein